MTNRATQEQNLTALALAILGVFVGLVLALLDNGGQAGFAQVNASLGGMLTAAAVFALGPFILLFLAWKSSGKDAPARRKSWVGIMIGAVFAVSFAVAIPLVVAHVVGEAASRHDLAVQQTIHSGTIRTLNCEAVPALKRAPLPLSRAGTIARAHTWTHLRHGGCVSEDEYAEALRRIRRNLPGGFTLKLLDAQLIPMLEQALDGVPASEPTAPMG